MSTNSGINLERALIGPGSELTGAADVVFQRFRVAIADIIAGKVLLAAIAGYKYRMVSCRAIAIGADATTVTTVDILGTQSSASVKLAAFGQASLTRSAVVAAGNSGGTVLADGASFQPCDANTAITIGQTGSNIAGCTSVDILIDYTVEAA